MKDNSLKPEDFHERWRLSTGRAFGTVVPEMGPFYPKLPKQLTVAPIRLADQSNKINISKRKLSSSTASTGRLYSQFELYDFALPNNNHQESEEKDQ